MTIKWSEQATKELVRTAGYIQSEFGNRAKAHFIRSIQKTANLLEENPSLGSAERFLSDEPVTYRSVVVGRLSKIIYYIHNDVIEIVDLWDTRREPKTQSKRLHEKPNQ